MFALCRKFNWINEPHDPSPTRSRDDLARHKVPKQLKQKPPLKLLPGYLLNQHVLEGRKLSLTR